MSNSDRRALLQQEMERLRQEFEGIHDDFIKEETKDQSDSSFDYSRIESEGWALSPYGQWECYPQLASDPTWVHIGNGQWEQRQPPTSPSSGLHNSQEFPSLEDVSGLVKDPLTKKGEFSVKHDKLLFTYMGIHLDRVHYRDWLRNLSSNPDVFDKNEPKYFRIGHETAPTTGLIHSHVCVNFGYRIGTSKPDYFDYTFQGVNYHPNIKPIMKDYDRVLKYVIKSDPFYREEYIKLEALDEAKSDGFINSIKDCKTKKDAVMTATRGCDVGGIITAWQVLKKIGNVQRFLDYISWGWQKPAESIFSTNPHPRLIYWLWSQLGSIGKTTWITSLMAKYPRHFYCIMEMPTYRDASTIVSNALESGWNGHAMIVNLTRSFQDRENIWSTLEGLKDAIMTAVKYNGSSFIKGDAHLMVMANFPPSPYHLDGRPKISLDRFNGTVFELMGDDPAQDPNPPFTYIRDQELAGLFHEGLTLANCPTARAMSLDQLGCSDHVRKIELIQNNQQQQSQQQYPWQQQQQQYNVPYYP